MTTNLNVLATRGIFNEVSNRLVCLSTLGTFDVLNITSADPITIYQVNTVVGYNVWDLTLSIGGTTTMYVRGSSIVIEASIKEYTPFGSAILSNPSDGVTIIVKKDGTTILDNVSMINSNTGKYYYIWNTSTTYTSGEYIISVTVDDDNDGYDTLTINLT